MAGHIKKRKQKDGSVRWQVQMPNPAYPSPDPRRPGKLVPRRIVKTFDKKIPAQQWMAREAAKMQTGDFIDPRTSATPFRELVVTWERTRAAKLAPKTRERYESVTRVHLLPAFGSTPIGKLSRPRIKEWFAASEVSPGTARKIQIVLSSILSEGVELGLLRENPAARLKLARPPRRDMTVLTDGEVRALAEAIPRASDGLAVWVAAYTGLRAGELWALRRRDIDLDGRRLIVTRTLANAHGRLEFVHATKTEGSRRVIGLPVFLTNRIEAHFETLADDPDTLVFTAAGGGGPRKDGEGGPVRHELFVRRVFKPAVNAALPAGKQDLRFHDLRHTCASILIASGASIVLVQKRLGHSSATTTLDRYSWLYPSQEAALADALDAGYNAAAEEPAAEDQEPPALAAV